MNRQRLILFLLVIGFGMSALWSYQAMPRQKTVKELTYKPGQQAKVTTLADKKNYKAGSDDGTRLKLEQLDQEQSRFKGYRRNLFKPIFVDELKMVKSKAVAVKPVSSMPSPPSKITVPVAHTDAPVIMPDSAPLARFTFLGFMKKGAVKTIFLAKEKDILLVKKGDTIAGRYEAVDITDQALTLSVAETGDEIVIPLVENRPLSSNK